KLDVRLHTHLAEDPDEDAYCLERFGRRPVEQFEEVGWLTSRSWVAHCVYPSPPRCRAWGPPGWASPIARARTCSWPAAGSPRCGSSARPASPSAWAATGR